MPPAAPIRRLLLRIVLPLLALSIIAFVWLLRDEPSPDLSDLAPRPRLLPAADNTLLVIRALAAERAPATMAADYQTAETQLLENPAIWNEPAATLIATTRPDLWPRLDQALRLPRAESPLPTSTRDIDSSNYSKIQSLWKAAAIRAELTARTQSPDAGLDQALALLKNSSVQTASGGTLLDYLVSAALRRTPLHTLRSIIANTTPSTTALRDALQRINNLRPQPTALAETFRSELVFGCINLPDLPAQTRNPPVQSLEDEKPPLGVTWFFKPNQTLRWMAERHRTAISLIGRPLTELETQLPPPIGHESLFSRIPNPDNALGRYSIRSLSRSFNRVLKLWLRDQTTLSATEAWLAVTLYQRDHTELPPTLDALVPAYLPAVPLDYFDGAPIRYSRTLGVIWSVGETHLAITTKDQVTAPRDIVFYLGHP